MEGKQSTHLELTTFDDVDGVLSRKPEVANVKKNGTVSFRVTIIFTTIGVVAYVADLCTDITVAYTHYAHDNSWWCIITCVLMFQAGLVTSLYSIWCHYESSNEKRWKVMDHKQIVFHVLMIAPLIRYLEVLYHASRYHTRKHEKNNLQRTLDLHRDATTLGILESIFESGPQLLLQLYIMSVQKKIAVTAQALCCCVSLFMLSWAPIGFMRVLRAAHGETFQTCCGNYFSAAVHFTWRVLVTSSRVVALALFASVFKAWIFLIVGVHVTIMFGCLRTMKSKFFINHKHPKAMGVAFDVVIAIVYNFYFITVKETDEKLSEKTCITTYARGSNGIRIVYYILLLIEHIIISVLVSYSSERRWYYKYTHSLINGLFISGITIQAMYYKWCHHKKLDDISE